MKEPYLYILMRTDLPSMGPGRAAAQASHAANAFWHKYGKTKDAQLWASQTTQGFGTAIVLGTTFDKIREICSVATAIGQKFPTDTVVDPDYVITVSSEVVPYIDDRKLEMFKQHPDDPSKYLFHRQEITCAYIFGDKEYLAPILGDLPLYS